MQRMTWTLNSKQHGWWRIVVEKRCFGFVSVKCLAMQGLQQNWWDSCRYHRKYEHLKLRESVTWRKWNFFFSFFSDGKYRAMFIVIIPQKLTVSLSWTDRPPLASAHDKLFVDVCTVYLVSVCLNFLPPFLSHLEWTSTLSHVCIKPNWLHGTQE